MINNFDQIIDLMDFRSSDDFYFLQLIRRKKENPDQKRSAKVLTVYYIKSKEELKSLENDIIDLCNKHNAIAYFNLNRRSFKKTTLQTLKLLTDSIISEDYSFGRKAFEAACGRFSAEYGDSKKWIIDIDFKEDEVHDNLYLGTMGMVITPIMPKGDKVIDCIETKNGYHLITKPFNVNEFRKLYPNIDIHKDNPTVLYCI